jgi:cytochrome c oxidase cbb3-type subunit III
MRVAVLWAVFAFTAVGATPKPGVKLPNGRADLATGQRLFEHQCALCHGPKGEGGRGPLLARARLSRAPDDAALVKVLTEGIRGTEMPSADTMSEREVRQTAAYVRSLGKVQIRPVPGSPTRGAEVYRGKGGCANCHAMKGEGGISGPDLAGIGTTRSAAYLRESLVTPEAALPEGYMLVTVAAKDGAGATGIRVNEDSFSIQVLDAAGRTHSFWKQDGVAVARQKGKSAMPSYKIKLTDEELTDLVAYLASLQEEK